jgi:zinc protease
MILASESVANDEEWSVVVDKLMEKHNASLATFTIAPREVLEDIRIINPRYVAIVDKPENINRDYVIDLHLMCREVDNDIYGDFLWGIITGYDASAAERMVDNSTEPLVIKDAVATIMELNSAKWFDNYAWVDDHTRGLWGYKNGRDSEIVTGMVEKEEVLDKFQELYEAYDPDLIVTAAHATQKNLEMPYSLGHIKPREGRLYTQNIFTGEERDIKESGKRRVYTAVGNCLIGDMNNTRESMAAAWMNGSNAATMIGYVVTTWHGRSGWGALKYWVTNPFRYTLAEAVYLNQQDFLHQQHQWYPELINERYSFTDKFMDELTTAAGRLSEVLGRDIDMESAADWDMMGFWHDRDVLAYYGDPMWQVMLQGVESEKDYMVESRLEGNSYIITITTDDDFSLERMRGDKFKQEHVLDLPFSYFFEERLVNPRMAEGQEWNAVIDENFILIYNADFKPSSTYEIVINVG